ncbi:MAG TPA: nucleotidyltransferase family protein [Pyrinomonadaceae bacterium]
MPPDPIAIIILAAGSSSRLGRPKQLLEYRGQTLIRRVVESAANAKLGPIVVVTSPELVGSIREQVTNETVNIVSNSEWKTGMSSSIRVGLSNALQETPDLAAVILALCDQPRITSETFLNLVKSFRLGGKPIVASEYSGTLGVPALFDRSIFDELLALKGERGAKSLIMGHAPKVERVTVPEAAFDVNLVSDLDRLD